MADGLPRKGNEPGSGPNPVPAATRVLLVDDHRPFLVSLGRFLEAVPDIEVVGVATSGLAALEKVDTLQPDLVLMDVRMPEMDGLASTRRLKARSRSTRVVILTIYDCGDYRHQASQAGADGFVSKADLGIRLLPLIEEVVG